MLNRRRARPLALLSLLLAAPGCVTDPDGIASVIATGSGTLSGTTTRTGSYDTAFDDRRTDGTGVFTLRFDTPGLPSVVTSPITVTPPPG
jgi:hypothetical protein